MRSKGFFASLAVSLALLLALAGCGGASNAPQETPADEGPAIEQLSRASGATVRLSADNQEASIDVDVKSGEALVIMANLGEGTDEVSAITYKGSEEQSTDSFYEGYGYSEAGVDPGTYTVEIKGGGATGTMWVLAYPADSVDVMNMDTEDIVSQVLGDVA